MFFVLPSHYISVYNRRCILFAVILKTGNSKLKCVKSVTLFVHVQKMVEWFDNIMFYCAPDLKTYLEIEVAN